MWNFKEIEIVNLMSHKHTKYCFENGSAVLVYGVNKDDEGAESNGSGKSTLMEAISIALVGDSIRRGVRTKDLVRNDCKQCEVSLELYNKVLKKDMLIKRVIYSNTKSSEVEVFINNEKQVNLVSVNDANSFILDLIGISREDLFSYYLISKEKYTPFFASSDTIKKQIISRFSGSDVLDTIEPLVNQDVKSIENEISTLNNNISSIEGKIEAYNDSLNDILNETSQDKIQLIIDRLNDEITVFKDKIASLELKNNELESNFVTKSNEIGNLVLVDYSDEIKSKEKEISCLQSVKDKSDEELKQDKEKIESQQQSIKQSKSNLNKDISDILLDIKGIRGLIVEERSSLNESLELQSILKSKLAGEIICPKCKHRFSLDKDMTLEEAELMLKDTDDVISEINSNISGFEQEIKSQEEEIEKIKVKISELDVEIEKLNSQIETIQDKHYAGLKEVRQNISDIEQQISEINKKSSLEKDKKDSLELEITSIERQIKSNNNEIESLNESCKDVNVRILSVKTVDNSEKIQEVQNKIDSFEKQKLIVLEQKQLLEIKLEETKSWTYIFKSFKSSLANKSIKAIEEYTNLYLQKMRSNLSIETDGYKELSNGKLKEEISAKILRSGLEEGTYGKYSSGERGRIDISSTCAIQTLLNLSCESGGLNFLGVDEALDSIDSKGIESIINALQDIGKTIMIISQNTSVNIDSRYLVKIQKHLGIGKIVI